MLIERLRELREANDLTQKEIADVLRCSQVAYSNYKIGRRNLPVEDLVTLAQFYNVTTDYIVGLTKRKRGAT